MIREMDLEENIRQLLAMTDEEWGQYAFSRDPIRRKITDEQKEDFIRKANISGHEQARKLKEQYGDLSIVQYSKKLGIRVRREESEGSDNYIVFAKYNYPDIVTIYMKNVRRMQAMIEEQGLGELLEHIDIESVLLAHEMYHYFEEHEENVYSKDTKVVLWKIASFQYKSGVIALGEIAAMAFAKELLGLSYNPYVFDSLLLFPHNEEKATNLMKDIFTYKKEKECIDG